MKLFKQLLLIKFDIDRNMAIQYTIVALILILAIVWMVLKFRKHSKKGSGCCGCALSDKCNASKNNSGCSEKKA